MDIKEKVKHLWNSGKSIQMIEEQLGIKIITDEACCAASLNENIQLMNFEVKQLLID